MGIMENGSESYNNDTDMGGYDFGVASDGESMVEVWVFVSED